MLNKPTAEICYHIKMFYVRPNDTPLFVGYADKNGRASELPTMFNQFSACKIASEGYNATGGIILYQVISVA